MRYIQFIIGLLNPGFYEISNHNWDRINYKLVKSFVYILVGGLGFYSAFYFPDENVIGIWVLIISMSLAAFGGLLLLSGLMDVLQEVAPFLGRKGSLFLVLSVLSAIILGVLNFVLAA
jgi:hypothetical protein